MAGCLKAFEITNDGGYEEDGLRLADARALTLSLPLLQTLHIAYGGAVSGEAVVWLVSHLRHLTNLQLDCLCVPGTDIIAAAVAAQAQAEAGARAGHLCMEALVREEENPGAIQAAATRLTRQGLGGPSHVTVRITGG